MQACELARALVGLGALKLGEFTLSSGMKSSIYIDMRLALSEPTLYPSLVDALSTIVRRLEPEVVVGVATAGIPWASMIGLKLGLGIAYVRRERKGYGTRSQVEGRVTGKRVVVVDDVATTGASLAEAIRALRSEGAAVAAAVVIVDRCQGACTKLKSLGVELKAVITLRKLVQCVAHEVPQAANALKELSGECAQTLL